MPEHRLVAVGGTFDHFHVGHERLILTAFEKGKFVVLGVTSDGFLERNGKPHDQDLETRLSRVKDFLNRTGLLDRTRIVVLEDHYGPTILDPEIEGIIVTEETAPRAEEANRIREKRGMGRMNVYIVDYVMAADGKPVSSTRIRNKEIDEKGNVIKHQA